MERVYLISCDYLKSHTTINNNVDNNLLNSAIWEAQSIHIQQTIGTRLYDKLIKLVKTGDIHNPNFSWYKLLLEDYIMDAVAYWAFYECLPYVRFKVVNKGVESQYSEWSSNTDSQELNRLQEAIGNKAEFYTRRLSDFILENRQYYPEYLQNNRIDEMHPDGGEYFSGIQFDGYICPCDRTMGYNRNAIDIL